MGEMRLYSSWVVKNQSNKFPPRSSWQKLNIAMTFIRHIPYRFLTQSLESFHLKILTSIDYIIIMTDLTCMILKQCDSIFLTKAAADLLTRMIWNFKLLIMINAPAVATGWVSFCCKYCLSPVCREIKILTGQVRATVAQSWEFNWGNEPPDSQDYNMKESIVNIYCEHFQCCPYGR